MLDLLPDLHVVICRNRRDFRHVRLPVHRLLERTFEHPVGHLILAMLVPHSVLFSQSQRLVLV